MADVYPVFSSDELNSQVTFDFNATPPIGYLNFGQDPSEAPVYGPLATTEAADIAAFGGDVVIVGNLASTEARDTTLVVGVVSDPPTVISPAYSAGDLGSQVTFNFQPPVLPPGYLFWDLGPGSVIFVTLETTEATDTALFNGALTAASGTLDVTEAADTAAFFGDIVGADLSGNLAFTEPSDTAVFNAEVTGNVGQLEATEDPDVAAFTGSAIWEVILAATEDADSAIFLGELGYVSETTDTAAFIGFVMDVPPVPGVPEVLKFGIPVSLSRW